MPDEQTTRRLMCPLRQFTQPCETPRQCARECKYEEMNRELEEHLNGE